MERSCEALTSERKDVGEHAGAFVETAMATAQVEAAIAIEIERGIDGAPCAFVGIAQ